VGKISYSLYLWHWPVIVLLPQLEIALPRWASVLVMFVLASASYYLVELPTRSGRRTVPIALAALASTAALALFMTYSNSTYDISRFNKITYYGYYFDLKPNNFDETRREGARAAMDLPAREVSAEAYTTGGIILGPHRDAPDIVLLGDSHGGMWAHTVHVVLDGMGLTGAFYSMDGVSPFFQVPPRRDQQITFLSSDVKYRFDLARIEHIQAWKPKIVVVATRWSVLENIELARSTLNFLRHYAKAVLLIGQPPVLYFGNRFAAEQLCYLGVSPQATSEVYLPIEQTGEAERGNSIARELASEYDNVTFIPTADIFTRGSEALTMRNGNVVYLDDDHLTEYGAGLAADRIRTAIDVAIARMAAKP
jgi:hypothetical protein